MACATTAHSTLIEGSVGEEVIYLQQLLNKKSRATIAVDGCFGSETKKMVQIYQHPSRNSGGSSFRVAIAKRCCKADHTSPPPLPSIGENYFRK